MFGRIEGFEDLLVLKQKGYFLLSIHSMMAGRTSSFSFFLSPIKLSSTDIALIKTRSAHFIDSSSRPFTFMSTSLFSHASGSIAAMVNNPRGGLLAFLLINFRACLKLQKVSGNSG